MNIYECMYEYIYLVDVEDSEPLPALLDRSNDEVSVLRLFLTFSFICVRDKLRGICVFSGTRDNGLCLYEHIYIYIYIYIYEHVMCV